MNLSDKLNRFVNGWTKATEEQFTGHPLANLFRHDLKNEIEEVVKQNNRHYQVKASVGAGNWANVPWLSILSPAITSTTQDGIYPVYLFNADGSGFYLSLNQGTTTPAKEMGKRASEERAAKIKKLLLSQIPALSEWGGEHIDLKANTALGKSYEKPNIAAKFYDAAAIPTNEKIIEDLRQLLDIYKRIEALDLENILTADEGAELSFHRKLQSETFSPLPKPLLLLAGISGTGKTRFVREQAKATGHFSETYCLTSVRPDWHEPSDLLGYISRLNGDAEYILTDVLAFIAKAWRAIANAGLAIQVQAIDEQGDRLVVRGDSDTLQAVLPYWLCLDEMNLAPVEQYFADYLSVLETREWRWDGDEFTYSSDALLKSATINEVADTDKMRRALGFASSNYDELWALICEHGLPIPFNLMVAGTVNMDETTHGFSRKVLDRALSFDFGEFFPNNYDEFFTPNSRNKSLSYPIWSQARKIDLATGYDVEGERTLAFLTAVNSVLKSTPFELAYRALNELLLAVVGAQPQDEVALKAIWDDFMMCKVLPRIEGDADKLSTPLGGGSILDALEVVLEQQMAPIWDAEIDSGRPDLYREKVVADGVADEEKVIRIACRSRSKIIWMKQRLESATFTSFWP